MKKQPGCSARDKKRLFSSTVTSYSRVFARARRIKSRSFHAGEQIWKLCKFREDPPRVASKIFIPEREATFFSLQLPHLLSFL